MNKTAIKNFAVWARNKLIADITYRAGLVGVSDKGIAEPLPQSSKDLQFFDIGTRDYALVSGKEVAQRKALVKAIQDKEQNCDYATAFKAVIEEVAYTWFNRLIAIRFMEVNDYLPSRVRVLSSENQAKNEPDFVTTPFDTDMEFTTAEQDAIMQLKDENKLDDLFRMLFIKQCNKLHEILPELFENTNDYTELLLSISFTDSDGIVYHLVHDIDEDDFNIDKEGQVEIIGWMYQFYNTELNDLVYDGTYSKCKIDKELLPAATTIYTPDWAVHYMVENSLGRLWMEAHPNEDLKGNWKYYLEEVEQGADVQAQLEKIRAEYRNLNPEDIKVIDPCMGSGHILVYCFDVLMQIYESQGYTQRDAAQSILENNLFGLDIDKRAAQLSYFAVMMKARQYDRRIFGREIKPHVYVIEESNDINRSQLKYFGAGLNSVEKKSALNEIKELLDTLIDAKEYGSILNVDNYDWNLLYRFVNEVDDSGQMTLDTIGIDETKARLFQLLEVGQAMAQKYEVVITNPPYLGSSRFNHKLEKYAKDNYRNEKSDLSMIMLKHVMEKISKKNGFISFITTSSWMFLSSFEKMRDYMLTNLSVSSLVDFGTELFDGKVGHNPIVAWVNRKARIKNKMVAIRLVDYCYSRRDEKEPEFFAKRNRFTSEQENFQKIPGSPMAYWVSEKIFEAYRSGVTMETVAHPKVGMQTSNNDKYLRIWYEIDFSQFNASSMELKWIKYLKGGAYRKWYGNLEYLLHYNNNAEYILQQKNARVLDLSFLKKTKCTWTDLTSGNNSFRYAPKDTFYDISGHCFFPDENDQMWLLGYANTNIFSKLIKIFNSTFHCQVGDVAKIVVPNIEDNLKEKIGNLVEQNVDLSKKDWDSFATSWDFVEHPLVRWSKGLWDATAIGATMHYYYGGHPEVSCPLELCYMLWQGECNERFKQLKDNEEELNRIFIDIYGLQDELTPEVADKDVTVRKADLQRDIKSLLSYAVGCMFGRYSLDTDGLAYAGGAWEKCKYSTFIPDKDNCIPITDEPYFEDDVVGLFCAWLKKVYGEESLEENLDFIAKALGNKGSTSREVIRNYFLTDFIKDHNKTYQKRPIYWLFDSGKQNGFKALVYMHRWDADTVGNLRVEYLHKTQRIYEREIQRMQETMDNSHDSREINKASKRKEKLQKQLKETKDYDTMLAHIALSRIDIDLDDGVKVNYEKVQTGRDGKKMQILAKI